VCSNGDHVISTDTMCLDHLVSYVHDEFSTIPLMYWTLQNLKDSESKQKILHYGSIFSAATVCRHRYACDQLHCSS
jgi:hypothetical protein